MAWDHKRAGSNPATLRPLIQVRSRRAVVSTKACINDIEIYLTAKIFGFTMNAWLSGIQKRQVRKSLSFKIHTATLLPSKCYGFDPHSARVADSSIG